MTAPKHSGFIIVGPTASGKSSLALELAAEHDGVIINADSMQVYDALHVLTAQPPHEEQQQAPHRLYAALGANEKCSAEMWRSLAMEEIGKALEAGKTPILVGGTGFYIKSLIDGLSPIPVTPDEIREDVMALQEELGNPAFHAALEKRDPVMAERLHPNDTQRLIRAYETLEATGKSLAYWQSLPMETDDTIDIAYDLKLVLPDRSLLYERCDRRFDMMVEGGILEEVKALDEKIQSGEVDETAPVTHALGFHPLQSFLRGETGLEEAVDLSKQETRNYAKRQITWFKNQTKPHSKLLSIEIRN